MDLDVRLWLTLLVRWVHVFASILWVGTTYYFTWLDGRFSALEKSGNASPREVWMVHSGGFYRVEKTKLFALEHPLHWFRWEAAITWLSGMMLLGLVYWFGGVMVGWLLAKACELLFALALGPGVRSWACSLAAGGSPAPVLVVRAVDQHCPQENRVCLCEGLGGGGDVAGP